MKKRTKRSKSPTKRRFHFTRLHGLLLLIAFISAFGFFIFLKNRPIPQTTQVMQVDDAGGKVNLAFDPTPLSLAPNEQKATKLYINTYGQKVTAIDAEIIYDPTKLEVPVVTQGTFFTKNLANVTIAGGKIKFVYISDPATGGIEGQGPIAIFNLKLKPGATGESKLTITSNTKIAAVGWSKNVLRSAYDAVITSTAVTASLPPVASVPPVVTPPPATTCSPLYFFIKKSKTCNPTTGYTFNSAQIDCKTNTPCSTILGNILPGKTSGTCYTSLATCKSANGL